MMAGAAAEAWRPGFARRAPGFEDVRARAEKWRFRKGVKVNAAVVAALGAGIPDLSGSAKRCLALLASYLNQERLEKESDATVWASTLTIATRLEVAHSRVREYRRQLEAAGLLVRQYNGANRPAGEEAYDLSPFLDQLADIQAAEARIIAAAKAERRQYEDTVRPIQRARAPESRRLEQVHSNSSLSVTAANEEEGQETPSAAPHAPASDSSAEARRVDQVREELAEAVLACPEIAHAVTPALLADPMQANTATVERIAQLARDLLPEKTRDNAATARHAAKTHGPGQTLAMLAVALATPNVATRSGYFGALAWASPTRNIDFRHNFRSLARKRQADAPIPPAPVVEAACKHPTWIAVAEVLRPAACATRDGAGAWGSYLAHLQFEGLTEGALALTTRTGVAAHRIRRDHLGDILDAAQAAGLAVRSVSVTHQPMARS